MQTNKNPLLLVCVGILAGFVSGLIGVGGGIVIVPLLVFLGYNQHQAQGTSMGVMSVPLGALLSSWVYYRNGHMHFDVVAFIAIGFILGSRWIGSKIALSTKPDTLRRAFGVVLFVIAIYFLMD